MTLSLERLRALAAEYAATHILDRIDAPANMTAQQLADAAPALLAHIDAQAAEIARLTEILEARRELEDDIWVILKARLARLNPNFIEAMTVDEFRVFDRWIHMEAETLPQESEGE